MSGATKAIWRDWARNLPAHPTRDRILPPLSAWLAALEPAAVLLFMPMEGEPDLTPLLDSHFQHRFLTSRTPDRGPLTVHEITHRLERHRYGFLQPNAFEPEVDVLEVDIALVPGIAFDRSGNRLGHGSGYYDELLARMRAERIGIAPWERLVNELPSAEHDVTMHRLATPDGVQAVPVIGGPEVVEQVVAYIVRGSELMVFESQGAPGIVQVPAGTVEVGERLEDALVREATEESGVPDLSVERLLGVRDARGGTHSDLLEVDRTARRFYFKLTTESEIGPTWTTTETTPSESPHEPTRFDCRWEPLERARNVLHPLFRPFLDQL